MQFCILFLLIDGNTEGFVWQSAAWLCFVSLIVVTVAEKMSYLSPFVPSFLTKMVYCFEYLLHTYKRQGFFSTRYYRIEQQKPAHSFSETLESGDFRVTCGCTNSKNKAVFLQAMSQFSYQLFASVLNNQAMVFKNKNRLLREAAKYTLNRPNSHLIYPYVIRNKLIQIRIELYQTRTKLIEVNPLPLGILYYVFLKTGGRLIKRLLCNCKLYFSKTFSKVAIPFDLLNIYTKTF